MLTETDAAVTTFLARYEGGTRKTFASILSAFRAWCDDNGLEVLEVSRAQLEMYSHALADRGLKSSSRATYLSTLRTFYRLCVADGYIDRDPTIYLRMPKVYRDETKILGLDRIQLGRLIQHARSCGPERSALVTLMALLGLRVSEAVSVRIEDFQDTERGHRVLRIVGKGGKPASIPLPPPVARTLDNAAGDRREGLLITTATGAPATRHTAYRWLKTMCKHAGLPAHVHPHTLRHASITAALDAGVPLRDAQVFARHSDPRITSRYDRSRLNLDRHAAYIVSSFIAGAA